MRILVVWEPVLPTDWGPPSSTSLRRIPDLRASQFWDRQRLISHAMGEHDRRSLVWDRVLVYAPGAIWKDEPPQPLYQGGPVVRVVDAARATLDGALRGNAPSR